MRRKEEKGRIKGGNKLQFFLRIQTENATEERRKSFRPLKNERKNERKERAGEEEVSVP
jgi:hypothetical protein